MPWCSTLERAPELIKAGALDDTRPFWRLHANLPLLIACMALGRLAGLPPQSRSRLAAFSFQHVRTHGSGVLQSMVAAGPTLAHVQDSTANSVAVLLLQLDTVSQVLQLPEQLGTGAAALVPPQQLVSWLKDCTAVLRSLPAQGTLLLLARCCLVAAGSGSGVQCDRLAFTNSALLAQRPNTPLMRIATCLAATRRGRFQASQMRVCHLRLQRVLCGLLRSAGLGSRGRRAAGGRPGCAAAAVHCRHRGGTAVSRAGWCS